MSVMINHMIFLFLVLSLVLASLVKNKFKGTEMLKIYTIFFSKKRVKFKKYFIIVLVFCFTYDYIINIFKDARYFCSREIRFKINYRILDISR